MNKLTLVTLISSALSAGAMADDQKDKIAMSFADLDKNSDGYISRDEANKSALGDHFDTMNLNDNDMVTRNEFNAHVSNNPSHFTGEVVASVQKSDNGINEVDPKTVSAAGEDDIVLATEARSKKSATMTAKNEANARKDMNKEVAVDKNIDVDVDTNTDEMAMADETDVNKESTMAMRSEQQDMDVEKNVAIDKDVDIDAESDEVAMSDDADIEKESSMTVKTEEQNMGGEKNVNIEKDVNIESDSDEMAMAGDTDIEKESSMTVKTEEQNMGTKKNVDIEKDVDVDMETEAATIAATEFDKIDTDQDGKLTKAEVANAADKVKFHEIDINNDEMVSRAEYDSYKRTDAESGMNDYDE